MESEPPPLGLPWVVAVMPPCLGGHVELSYMRAKAGEVRSCLRRRRKRKRARRAARRAMAAMPAAMPPIWARVRLGLAVAGEVEDGGAVAAIEVEVEVEDEVIDVGAAVVVAAVDEVEVGVEVGIIAIVVEL